MSTFVRTRGDGAPVLLLHSSGLSSNQWRRLGTVLSTTHRVLAPDLPGYGRNPRLSPEALAGYDFQRDVDAAEELARDAGEPVHLVGHSYGGLLAVTLARRGTVPVASLSAYEPVTVGLLEAPEDDDALATFAQLDELLDPTAGLERFVQRFVDWWNAPGAWAAMPAAGKEPFLASAAKTYAEVSSLMKDRTPRSGYANIEAPTLVLSGAHSPLAARRIAVRLADTVRRGRHHELPSAGHMGPMTHAAEVNALIAAHIRAS